MQLGFSHTCPRMNDKAQLIYAVGQQNESSRAVCCKCRMFGCPEPASSCIGMRVAGRSAFYQLMRYGTTLYGHVDASLTRRCWFICTSHIFLYPIRQSLTYFRHNRWGFICCSRSTCSYIPMKPRTGCSPRGRVEYSRGTGYASLIALRFQIAHCCSPSLVFG